MFMRARSMYNFLAGSDQFSLTVLLHNAIAVVPPILSICPSAAVEGSIAESSSAPRKFVSCTTSGLPPSSVPASALCRLGSCARGGCTTIVLLDFVCVSSMTLVRLAYWLEQHVAVIAAFWDDVDNLES